MINIYVITRYLTFPGAYIRCFWQQLLLRWMKVPTEDSRYIRKDEMCSHIEHELIKKTLPAFIYCFIPCLINISTAVGLAVCPYIFCPMSLSGRIFIFLSLWVSLSLFANCFPRIEDAVNLRERIYNCGKPVEKVLLSPFFALLYIGAYLERYSVTFIGALSAILVFVL